MFTRVFLVLVFAGVGFGLGWIWGGYDDPAVAEAREQARARFAELRPKAQAGDPEAQFAVAEHYRLGLGVEANLAASSVWYRKAAEQVHADAAFALGRLYEAGRGVRRDYGEAALWYGVAADLGNHAKAQYALAMMHYHGLGFAPDPARAFELYEAAAEQGYAPAQHMLGAIYEHGWGIEPDLVAAYAWYSLAIEGRDEVLRELPNQDPLVARRKLAERMTKFRVRQGERQAAAWRRPAATDIVPASVAPPPPRTAGSVQSAAARGTPSANTATSRPWPFLDAAAP